LADRRGGAATPKTDVTQSSVDWSGEDISGQTHTRVLFVDLDLTEARNAGAVFTECTFKRAKFNASEHVGAAFLNCTFVNCNFFDAKFTECKLVGSMFDRCTFEITQITSGNWSLVGLPGADLRSATLAADLTGARCEESTFHDVDLAGALLHKASFAGCDLRGSDVSAIDPETTEIRGAIVTIEQAVVIAEALGLDIRPGLEDDRA
jgi:uncharacterized protein YjbI with pentapeptide repeats